MACSFYGDAGPEVAMASTTATTTATATVAALPRPAAVRFQCQQCHMSFASKSAHTAHARSHARAAQVPGVGGVAGIGGVPIDASSASSGDPYRCDVCRKTFAVPARLVRHYRTHTGERPFECEFCHKMFSVKENLQVHRRIHTKERPYRCRVCERAFEHSGKLHRHMRIHTGERPHACSVCGKTFIQSGQLVIHLRTHTGEKPYRCSFAGCGKGFTCSKQLKVHSRTHTGEKPYHCDICFRDFGYNHVLKLHRVQHYGSKCYKCTICEDTFKNKKEMEAHIKGHADEMPDQSAADRDARVDRVSPSRIFPRMKPECPTQEVERESPLTEFAQTEQKFSVCNVERPADRLIWQTSPVPPSYREHSPMETSLYAATVVVAQDRETRNNMTSEYLGRSTMDMSEIQEPFKLSYVTPVAGIPSPPPQMSESYSYEPLTLIHQGYFAPQPFANYRPVLENNSNIVRCVEAALAVAENVGVVTSPTPPASTPERSSSPEDNLALDLISYKEMSNLPLRKRKVYMRPIQTPPVRLNSVIQFAKAS